MANNDKDAPPSPRDGAGLRWHQGLQFKLALLLLLLLVLLTAGSFWASQKLVAETLADDGAKVEEEAALRLDAQLQATLVSAHSLAAPLLLLPMLPLLPLL